MNALRVACWLAFAQLRHRSARWLLVVAGVALAAALPVVASASGVVTADRALRHAVGELPPGDRSLTVSYNGLLSARQIDGVDASVRHDLSALTPARARRQMLFRRIGDTHGGSFYLGAVDGLTTAVRLRDGRMPRSCTPIRCEVVVTGVGDPALDPSLGVVVVGHAVVTDPLVLSGTFAPDKGVPLLLSSSVQGTSAIAALDLFQRSYGWVTPIDLTRVTREGVASYVRASSATADALWRDFYGLILTAPDDVLQTEDARARASAHRFALLGGSDAALMLGFALVAATGMRREHAVLTRLLRRRGAGVGRLLAVTMIESGCVVVAGLLVGTALGAVVAGWWAATASVPVHRIIGPAVLSALPALAVLGLAATAVVTAALGWPDTDPRAAWRTAELVAVAALGAALLGAARGSVGVPALHAAADPLLTALPVLVAVAAGVAAGRLWPLVVRPAERLTPRRAVTTRLALLGGLRRPLRAVVTVAFVAAATTSVVFAGAYRATLAQGADDQAAFDVPLDARLTAGSALATPLEIAPLQTYSTLVPGARAFGVVRSSAGVRSSAVDSDAVELVGVDPTALPLVRRAQRTTGAGDLARYADAVRDPAPPGRPLPAGTRTLAIPATGSVADLLVTAWFRDADGREQGATLVPSRGALVAGVPHLGSGIRFTALTVRESSSYATRHQHAIGEGDTSVPLLTETLHLGAPTADGTPLPGWSWRSWHARHAGLTGGDGSARVTLRLEGSLVVLSASTPPADVHPLPVLADPQTARLARGGSIEIGLGDERPVTARIVGVLDRFPATGTRFVVADAGALAATLDDIEPGTGGVREVWLWAPHDGAGLGRALAAAPYDRLAVTDRADLRAQLAADPIGRGAAQLLAAGALVAVLVGVAALALLVVAERRDDAGELYAWEADGVAPRSLRALLFTRAASVVAVGVPSGLVAGLVLAGATTGLVAVTAGGTTPRPPLQPAVGASWLATALAAGLVGALLVVAAAAAASLREPVPTRPEADLR